VTSSLGKPVSRRDGYEKTMGRARYTGEIFLPNMAYAAVVGATIASGKITAIDSSAALAADGVIAVFTHENLPKIPGEPHLLPSLVGGPAPGQSFLPLQGDEIHYYGQPVAIVVAETYEQAQYAGWLVATSYEKSPSMTTIDEGREMAYEPQTLFGGLMPARDARGDVEAALQSAEVVVEATYHMAANHHNALEAPTTTAVWDEDRLTLYDACMGVRATQLTVAHLLRLSLAKIRVVSNFVGGSFGSKAMVWPHVTLAAVVAREVGRPVRLALTRPQAFTTNGHREEQEHHLTLGATREGKLTAIRHEKLSVTSPFDDWAEPATGVSSQIYAIENFGGAHRLIRGNTMTPTFTRGPGESVAAFVLESSMDELAHQLDIDPVQLRLMNHGPTDPRGNPWSSDGLAECLQRGAELFGWEKRDPTPRSQRDGDWLIGQGMAAAAYPVALFMPEQQARVRLYADGSAVIEAGTPEFGTGVGTMMTQVAADGLGLPLEAVSYKLGDSDLPNITSAVGSAGSTMVSAAVFEAANALRQQLVALAVSDAQSPVHDADPSAVDVQDGRLTLRDQPDLGESYVELLGRNRRTYAEAIGSWRPPPLDTPHGLLTFGAQFAEVAVDPELGLVRVRRMLGVFAPGRVLNPKLARSQLMGGMLWGLSQALLEANQMDSRYGRWGAIGLGEYLVPVNADSPEITIEFVEVEDQGINPLGVKGVGEIGQIGTAGAIANAVFNATGRRIRELPLAAELVMDPAPAAV
jgi:xanthine dehydrogenase YagR molybdenum-binding subunit